LIFHILGTSTGSPGGSRVLEVGDLETLYHLRGINSTASNSIPVLFVGLQKKQL